MSRTDPAPEASMEEILASIRRIITEDPGEQRPLPTGLRSQAPTGTTAPASQHSTMAPAASDAQAKPGGDFADDIARALNDRPAVSAAPIEDDDLLDMTNVLKQPAKTAAPPQRQASAPPHIVQSSTPHSRPPQEPLGMPPPRLPPERPVAAAPTVTPSVLPRSPAPAVSAVPRDPRLVRPSPPAFGKAPGMPEPPRSEPAGPGTGGSPADMTHRGGHSDEHPIKQPRQSAAWPATDAGVSPRPRLFPLPAGDDTGADDVLDLTKAAAPAPPQASAEATTLESGPAPRAGGALADKLRASRTASEPPPDSGSSEAIDEVEEDVIDLGSSKLVAQPVTEPDPPAPPPATPTAEAPGASSDPGRSAPPAPVEATAAAAAPAASESNQADAQTREPVVAAPEAPSAAGPAIVEPAPAAVTPRDEVSPVSVRAEAPPAAIDSAGAVPGQPPNETTKASDAPKVDPQPDLAGAVPGMAQSVVNALPGGARTLEDTVAELLRPMLKEWLDENMPRIVQKALQKEEFKEPPSFQAPN